MTDATDEPKERPESGRRAISSKIEADIRRLILAGEGDQAIAKSCGISQPTVAIRRARMTAPPNLATATPQVIGTLRHLAASDGLTIVEISDRLQLAESDAEAIVHALITLGVIRRTAGEPVRYGIRKDWL